VKKYHSTILIVDDDPNDLLLIENAFRGVGVTTPIHALSGGAEAIAYMKGEGKYADRATYAYPSFITTDLKMPGTDGLAVLDHLQKNPLWTGIPTVVLTGSRDADDIKRAYLLGANSYHVKPSTLEGLRQLARTLHEYWMTCEIPQVDHTGRQSPTNSIGKLGERFA
jgi:CheY-like chemotaxis protein